jgi:hypothetical protein
MNRAAIVATATAFGRQLGVQGAVSRYRDARRWLHTPASRQSRLGLDWTNFFIADVQAGFGTFVAFYLASLGWSQTNIGLALGRADLPACWRSFRAGRSPTQRVGSAGSPPPAFS